MKRSKSSALPDQTHHLLAGNLTRALDDEKMWVATGYEVVDKILQDRRFGKQAPAGTENRLPEYLHRRNERLAVKQLNFLDPPQHTRVRRLLHKAFTTTRVEQYRTIIQSIVDQLLDRLIPRGSMDIMRDFAYPVSSIMICDMFGIPAVKRARLRELANTLITAQSVALSTEFCQTEQLNLVAATEHEFDQHLTILVNQRRNQPQDDLISVLATVQIDSERLSLPELLVNLRALFIAVHEALVNLTGNSLLALHNHPEQLELLKNRPELMPRAIDECLRYDSPIRHVYRIAQEDLLIAGKKIRAAEAVFCSLSSANHDENVFPAPSQLDILRNDGKFKSFGSGIHFCLAAQLVKLTTEIALASLLRRIPTLTLIDNHSVKRRASNTIQGLSELPAKW